MHRCFRVFVSFLIDFKKKLKSHHVLFFIKNDRIKNLNLIYTHVYINYFKPISIYLFQFKSIFLNLKFNIIS